MFSPSLASCNLEHRNDILHGFYYEIAAYILNREQHKNRCVASEFYIFELNE